MRIQVDVDRSIKKGRLVPVMLSFGQRIEIGANFFFALIFILACVVLPTVLLIKIMNQGTAGPLVLCIFACFFCAGTVVIYGLVRENRLTKFNGRELAVNKQLMRYLLSEKFETNLIYEGNRIISYYRRASFWQFGSRIIVLFDEDVILMNVSRFNQIGIKSFIHAIPSQILISSIIKDFSRKANSSK